MKSSVVNKSINWPSYLAEVEQSIIKGQHQKSRELLKKYSPLFGPREFATQLAEFALRVHMPLFALKKLHKYVRPENDLAIVATDLEKTIYASALYHLGAVEDAQIILKNIDRQKNPEAHFHLARSYMHMWDYASAATHLRTYLQQGNFDDYRKLCTRVNLAAALISVSRLEEAEIELIEVLEVCESCQHVLLAGNCYELLGQVYFFKKQHEKSLIFLNLAESKLKNQTGWYLLFVHKWILLNEIAMGQNHVALNTKLILLVQQAAKLEQWNTIRDLDYFVAVFSANAYLKTKVVFGSNKHFIKLRSHFYNVAGATKLKQFLWVPYPVNEKQILNGPSADFIFDIKDFKCNSLISKTFYALVSDLYEPSKLGEIFAQVYRGEVFNPYTSPGRVLKLLKRLDSWFIQKSIPLRVYFKKSAFEIRSSRNCTVVIRKNQSDQPAQAEFHSLKELLKDNRMNVKMICQKLQSSESTVLRLVNRALAHGIIAREGTGKSTRYFLPKRKARVAA